MRASRSHPVAAFLLCACGAGLAPTTTAAQTIRGRLTDRDTGDPIEGARVVLTTDVGDTVRFAASGRKGDFAVSSSKPGSFFLRAGALGYREAVGGVFELGEGGELTVEIRLQPEPITVEGLLVEAEAQRVNSPLELNGFYDRMSRGFGRFITLEDIESSTSVTVTDLFRGIGGVMVAPTGFTGDRVLMRAAGGSFCRPTIYIDNIVVDDGGATQFALDRYVSKGDIDAIEVYRRPGEIPIEYNRARSRVGNSFNASCGVVLIWTKR